MLEVENRGDVKRRLVCGQGAVTLDVTGHSVDDVGHRHSGVGVVRVVVNDRRAVNAAGAGHGPETLIPMDVTRTGVRGDTRQYSGNIPRKIDIDTVLEQQALESLTDIRLVGRDLGAVHRAMGHGNHPRGLGAVDGGKVLLEPLVLSVGLGIAHVSDSAKWPGIGNEGLALLGRGLATLQVAGERPLGAVGKIGLAVKRDEMGKTVVERVPHVAHAAGLSTGHAEAVLVGSEVPGHVRDPVNHDDKETYLWDGGQL